MPDAEKKDANGSRFPSAPAGQRWPRRSRLVRRSEFEAVYRRGRRRTSKHFAVFGLPSDRPYCRFGISVKRTLGNAVRRNRIRRRTREILRQLRPEIQTGWDIVVHPRGPVATEDFTALYRELHALLRELMQIR